MSDAIRVDSSTSNIKGQEDKPKKRKPRPALPALAAVAGASEMTEVKLTGWVDSSPTNWESLPVYSLFSRSADGSFPLFKKSKSQYVDLRTGKSEWCGSGRCYKVII